MLQTKRKTETARIDLTEVSKAFAAYKSGGGRGRAESKAKLVEVCQAAVAILMRIERQMPDCELNDDRDYGGPEHYRSLRYDLEYATGTMAHKGKWALTTVDEEKDAPTELSIVSDLLESFLGRTLYLKRFADCVTTANITRGVTGAETGRHARAGHRQSSTGR